jgi:drug/metabolite transporter (DMT)-like permease
VLQWQVILLAALGVLLLVVGLALLILPAPYEGPEFIHLDEQHAVRAIDALAVLLLILGCALAWSAGGLWQRRMYKDRDQGT